MADSIVKDVSDIHSALFDHKPVLRKEIETFVKEFEERRKDGEVDQLFHILERVTELKETEIPRTASVSDIHLPKLSAEVQVAESIANKLVNKLKDSDAKYAEALETSRKGRAAEWDTFVHDMTAKCIRIDNLYKDKQQEVRKLYQKAEEPFLKTTI